SGTKRAEREKFQRYVIGRESLREPVERQANDPDLFDFADDIRLLTGLLNRAMSAADAQDDKYLAVRLAPVFKQLEALRKSMFEMQQKHNLLWSQTAVIELMKTLADIVTDELTGIANRADIVD